MRRIDKGPPPQALLDHRRTDGATYDGLRKGPLQERLCQVQHRLCCFCQSRIEPDGRHMRIAHFLPQSDPDDGAERSLDWANMWGACSGGEFHGREENRGAREKTHDDRFHCDKLQGERKIHEHLDPARYVAGTIRYHHDGTVDAKDPEVNAALNEVLGLNVAKLCNNRAAALERVRDHVRKHDLTTSQVERLMASLADPHEASWPPYLDLLLWYLRKKASRVRGISASSQS